MEKNGVLSACCTRRFERVVGQYSDKNNMPYNILITS